MRQEINLSKVPFNFVLEDLERLNPVVGRLFGSFSVYVGEKIMLILRQRREHISDNGVWIATSMEHHASLRQDLPAIRSIEIFGPGPTGWQVIPEEADDFEQQVSHACRLIMARDPRIGKVPAKKRSKKNKK